MKRKQSSAKFREGRLSSASSRFREIHYFYRWRTPAAVQNGVALAYNWLCINQMQDNVRVGKESLTKKISYHEQHPKKYSTINSLQKEPTRKHITLANPKHQLSLNPKPERKLKSLSKQEGRRRWDGSHPELATLDGLKRNLHQISKFSLSKEGRDREASRQKYKRSEHIRSAIENKKISTLNRVDRKHTEATVSLTHLYHSVSSEASQPHRQPEIKEPALDSIINPHENYDQEPTLEDVFLSAAAAFHAYLLKKEEETGGASTVELKQRRESSLLQLQAVEEKLRVIMQETGEMSLRTVTLLGLVKYEQNKYNECIMYLNKIFDATEGNLLLIDLPQSRSQSEQAGSSCTPWCLKLLAYISLAQSYKATNNYLCSINVLLKWQIYFFPAQPSQPVSLKPHYQTLQPREAELDKQEFKQSQRLKKKSYLLVNLQNDSTLNKLKKHSSMQSNGSAESIHPKKNPTGRPRLDLDQQPPCLKTANNHRETKIYSHPPPQERIPHKEITVIYLLIARLYVNIKSFQSAAGYYRKCLNFTPHKIQPILELASLYYAQKGGKVCLDWLQLSIASFEREKERNEKWELDLGYLRYYKALILLQEGKNEESLKLFYELKVKQLSSQVNYYKGLILLKRLSKQPKQRGFDRNKAIESILMHFNESISCYTSQQYISKSFFQILVVLLFQKKDYYGAQYELARFKKMQPRVQAAEEQNPLKSQIKIYEDEELGDGRESRVACSVQREGYLEILSELTQAVICILKMKIAKGLTIIKQIGVRVEGETEELQRCLGAYYSQLAKVVLQFKFYAYYIQREYEMSLKHVNKLLQAMAKQDFAAPDRPAHDRTAHDRTGHREVEAKLINTNRLMLECMILMKQTKYNYAMSKLKEIEGMLGQGAETQAINSTLILNNFNMVKALCYINIYAQLEHDKREALLAEAEPGAPRTRNDDDNNKEILLSAEELLRHCLISDKENSLIYYLIAVIHHELQSYESSLKYVRQALEYSDDHMIKHYFAKANTKALMGRYDQAIKDYTNAVIVFKEQRKGEGLESQAKGKLKEDLLEEYYQEKQLMINEIYLNRAVAYLKEAYALSRTSKYAQNANVISSYRLKASEDLQKYFSTVLESKIELSQQRVLRQRLLLFMHTEEPQQVIEIGKKFTPRLTLLNQEDHIAIYYLTKQLNNCISNLQAVIRHIELKAQLKQQEKMRKDSVPNKYKKISVALPKSSGNPHAARIPRLQLDLRCLQALKRSSSRGEGALEESLIQLLELTEQIYKQKEEELSGMQKEQHSTVTLEQLLSGLCGEIFRWSDILFFIGVIHYQLQEYETAIKYFEESYNEKKMSRSLYSLGRHLQPRDQAGEPRDQAREQAREQPREQASDEEQDDFIEDLEPLFENRVYSKEEMDYNLGLCYLMLKKYKQAYYYLQRYPRFLDIIRKGINQQSSGLSQNEFIAKPNARELLIEDQGSSQGLQSERLHSRQKRENKTEKSISRVSDSQSEISQRERLSQEQAEYPNITPFPIRNRLCSIYSPRIAEKCSFNLSFCLPKIALPTLSLFHQEEIQLARLVDDEDDSISQHSEAEKLKQGEQDARFQLSRENFESAVRHLSLLDLEMKPIAPWIRQNANGIIFTENLVNESVELNSERAEKKREKSEDKNQDKKGKKDRYCSQDSKE